LEGDVFNFQNAGNILLLHSSQKKGILGIYTVANGFPPLETCENKEA
jgi:hypothetical protein